MNTALSLTEEGFVTEFRNRMQSHRLWQHPYFRMVRENPTLKLLRTWAVQAGRIDEVFAEILQNMLNNPTIPNQFHRPIRENYNDETGNGDASQEHFTLFRDILSVLEISEEEYRRTKITNGTRSIVEDLLRASLGNNPLEILGMMASEELICPAEFPLFLEAMSNFSSNSQLTYFNVHIEADVRHANDLIRMLYRIASNLENGIEQAFYWQQVDLENNVLFYDCLLDE